MRKIIKLRMQRKVGTRLAERLGIIPPSTETKEQLHRLEVLRAQYARAKKAKSAPKKAGILPFPKIGARAKKTKTVAEKKRIAA
jgi:hypothetical protein